MAVPLPKDERFGRYVEYYGLVKRALVERDAEQLHRIELVTQGLQDADRKVSSVAIHDVAVGLPMRSEAHFVGIVEEDWKGDHEYFAQLMASLRARAARGT